MTVTGFICNGFSGWPEVEHVLMFCVLLLEPELREYEITFGSYLSFDSRTFPSFYVKGRKTNDRFSHEGGGAVDSLVFVSRHLSERNLDKYEIFTLCCIN